MYIVQLHSQAQFTCTISYCVCQLKTMTWSLDTNQLDGILVAVGVHVPFLGVRLVSCHSALRLLLFFHGSLLLAFSLPLSSSSAFLISLFAQSSRLSSGLPRFLQVSCFFLSDIFGNLSFLFLPCVQTISPGH